MAANAEFQRVGASRWASGLANLLHKENRGWWASRRWLVQSIVWSVVVNGLVWLMMVILPNMTKTADGGLAVVSDMERLSMGLQTLFEIGSVSLAVGAIILAQSEIIGERQLGVTEWLLSKPVSRASYVLSKLFAHGLGVLVILVGLQGAIAYGLLWLELGEPFPLQPYLVSMVGLAVHTLFYLALTLMMGVLTTNRNTVLGVALGVALGGPMLLASLGKLAMLTPWILGKMAYGAALVAVTGGALPVSIWQPIGITAALSVIVVAVTLARFERLEF